MKKIGRTTPNKSRFAAQYSTTSYSVHERKQELHGLMFRGSESARLLLALENHISRCKKGTNSENIKFLIRDTY